MSRADIVVPVLHLRVLAGLGDGFAERAGDLLTPLVQGLTSQLAPVSELVADDERGYAKLFNLDESPEPGWLGQWDGVPFDRAMTREQQIARVRSRGRTRGTPDALVAAARGTLVSSTSRPAVVQLIERDGSAYRLTVKTYAGETPDAAATLAALLAAKPYGLLLTHVVLAGQDFHEVIEYGDSFGMVRDRGDTFGALLRRVPDSTDERTYQAAAAGTFEAATRNTFARYLRPHQGRDRTTTVRTFSRLTATTYAALRAKDYQSLPREGA